VRTFQRAGVKSGGWIWALPDQAPAAEGLHTHNPAAPIEKLSETEPVVAKPTPQAAPPAAAIPPHHPPHDGPYMTINGVKFPAEHIEPEHWLLMIQLWKRSGVWPQTLGPPPGRVGCACPGDILQVAGCDVRAA